MQQFERWSQRLVPPVFITLMVLLGAVPMRMPGVGALMPSFVLIAIYYWGLFVPGALPFTFLFVLGIVQDALYGTPLGFSSFINVSFALLVTFERRVFIKALFGTLWFGFALLSLVTVAAQWMVLSLYDGKMLPMGPCLIQWCATVFVYPPLHLFFARLSRQSDTP